MMFLSESLVLMLRFFDDVFDFLFGCFALIFEIAFVFFREGGWTLVRGIAGRGGQVLAAELGAEGLDCLTEIGVLV